MSKSSNLKKDFSARALWVNYRSSAIFPLFLGKSEDTVLVFQNYWQWKSNIENIIANIFIRNCSGKLIYSESIHIDLHNQISIKNLLSEEIFIDKGTIEIEIIGDSNLGYPFPAILCFYKSMEYISVVHSAGRILNSNESHQTNIWKESNFLTIYDDNLAPFISIFNGQNSIDTELSIRFLKLPVKELIFEKTLPLRLNPFGSKVFYANDFLNESEKKLINGKRFFIEFEHKNKGIFGRYVVGNYLEKRNMHFCTHSFMSIAESGDIIDSSQENPVTSFLPVFNKRPLRLKFISYPTNISSEVMFKSKESNLNEIIEKDSVNVFKYNPGNEVFEGELKENKFVKFYSMDRCPARLNISYNFSLPNSVHPTDIATGFKGNVYPKKFNHWGSIINLPNWKVMFFIRNCSHSPQKTESGEVEFTFFDNKKSIKKIIHAQAETCTTLELEMNSNFSEFLSWKCNSSVGTIEIFWVCFNEQTGAICGEHSF
jgi:hypothetical protein